MSFCRLLWEFPLRPGTVSRSEHAADMFGLISTSRGSRVRLTAKFYSSSSSSACFVRSAFLSNFFGHLASSECVCMWNLRLDILLKARSHREHWKGFSPVWIMMWFLKLPFWWNPLWQTSHTKVFSWLWVLRWVFSVEERLKHLPHVLHLWGFFSVWMILCRQRVLESRKPLPQILQTKGLLLVWSGIFRWIESVYLVLKIFPHWLHRCIPLSCLSLLALWLGSFALCSCKHLLSASDFFPPSPSTSLWR